jgi:hypothetical protein
MQAATHTMRTTLAEPQRDAITWLANRLRWERTLDRLRSKEVAAPKRAA